MTDPYTEARNASAGMPGHSMSADVGVRDASNDKLREALEAITHLRPFGDVDTCKAPRKLVEQMERIALTALALNTPTESVKAPEGVTQAGKTTSGRPSLRGARDDTADLEQIERLALASAKDRARTVEILRRALAWHGDPQRMATTREEWQQEVDAAIVWVKANPEPGRPSFSTLAASPTPITADDAVAKELERERVGEWRPVESRQQLKGMRRSPKYYPAIGEACRMSGPNCDDADGYTWANVEVLWRDDLFIVTRSNGCWPTVTKLELALFEPAIRSLSPDTEGEGM